jgi:hypothetical protein
MKQFILLLALAMIILSSVPAPGVRSKDIADESRRKQITNDILNNLLKEKYEDVRKDFHSSLNTVLPVEKISEVWNTVISQSGAYKRILSTSVTTFQGYNQVKLRLEFDKENATLETTFTEDDKVLGLYIKP